VITNATATKFNPDRLVAAHGHGKRGLARALEVDAALLCRPFSQWQADRYAVSIGLHPCEVWPEWFESVAPAIDDQLPELAAS